MFIHPVAVCTKQDHATVLVLFSNTILSTTLSLSCIYYFNVIYLLVFHIMAFKKHHVHMENPNDIISFQVSGLCVIQNPSLKN